jgi:hypothetical protein
MPLEAEHVAIDRIGVQADRLAVGEQDRSGDGTPRLEEAPQCGQHLAQPIAPDVQVDSRPHQLDELLARVAPARVRQARQQHRNWAAREVREHHVAVRRAQAAEELHLPERRAE